MVFAVNPIACKHLVQEFDSCINISIFDNSNLSSPKCSVCDDGSENWICLKCGIVSCSRHVNGHAGEHYESTGHPISASFSDHSFWCYTCDTYVYDRCLHDIEDILGTIKFFSKKKSSSGSDIEEEEEYQEDIIKAIKNSLNITTAATVDEKEKVDDQIVPNIQSIDEEKVDSQNKPTTTTTTTTTTSTTSNTTTTTSTHISSTTSTSLESTNTTTTTTTATTPPSLPTLDDYVDKIVNSDEEDESSSSSSSGEEVTPTLVQRMKDMFFGSKSKSTPTTTTIDHNLKQPTIEEVANYINSGRCKNIIVMTGAGISVAAGIPDFRSPKTGLYQKLDKYDIPYPEAIFDIDFFKKNPKPFYVLSKELYPGSFNPTPVHYFIKLLNDKGLLLRNFTQNIDTLERVAGIPSDKLVEAHGSFASSKCVTCKEVHTTEYVKEKVFGDDIPYCKETVECKGVVKPDIVFFGESLPSRFNLCVKEDFPKCDLLIVIGTSLKVQPFASLINFAKDIPRVLINNEVVAVNPYGGFKFNDPSNKNDVKCIGDCQDLIKQFVKLLNWEDEFNQLINQKL